MFWFYVWRNRRHTFIMTKPPMDLKQFMLRQRVLKLYRDIFRSIKEVPSNEDRIELKNWARNDFKANKHHTDEVAIKMMIKYGERCLKELKQNLYLSR
ncbi:LYR motif-containing protein 2 [Cimex lectularius]|uniref:LYR motif-containing protein 2 n=1 Tax=Cimex lectularius TaxID=79782 RepID=A0A8I6SG91_CIMLE|nr:LYR motif-containing protein 2 [Cimex lectularius]XP_014260389.1 LYR motif-containing protein 2 [Cimex lectularius]XP_014260390.1 LYR motif-containing protein 2 [Cimex lectularius]XP_014260391.1 LYR motif-containing protein 2 [Cimex lectularius]XP_024083016.1 LYR motif-containing protein 2 [Cimex lectularius]